MAINFTEDKKYPNQNISERRETTYKPQIPAKNTMDNSNAIMYNNNKHKDLFAMPLTDFAKQWKEKNQGLFKYAGDVAKNSVDKGLKEAPDYMQDANEGTSFENVQTASVKRHLANDANDNKLYNAAMMELIGHLSKDNKETYLKHTQPLQKYIDAKDEFDFKHNNYTTTENVDTTPDENVRNLQRELNEAGYTDKFGQNLKEDGIYAGKTAYADDSMKADNSSQRIGNRANLPSRGQTVNTNNTYTVTNDDRYKTATVNGNEHQVQYLTATKNDLQPKMLDNSEVKLASADYSAQLISDKPDNLKYLPDTLYNAWDKVEDSIWKTGAKVLDIYGLHLTSDLLYLAASGSGNKYVATDGSYASKLLKNDKGLNKFINDIIWEYGTSKGNKNPDIPTVSYEIPLSNGDLGAALHKINLDIDAKQNSNGTWTATIKATDKFNFTEKENIFKQKGLKNKFLWLANNIAAYDTDWGLLDNVDVEISFKNHY